MSAPTRDACLDGPDHAARALVEMESPRTQRSPEGALAEQPDVRPPGPTSELALVDQHEAQGWRVRQDERLDRLFEERCDWLRAYGRARQLAVDSDELSLTYDELDARANQLARYLRLHGVSAGDRIGLLFDRPIDAYVSILGVLKIGAAYVPLDVSFSADRMAAIVKDARARTVLSTSDAAARVDRIELLIDAGTEIVGLDLAAPLIAEQDSRRLLEPERGMRKDQLAYITYSTGGDDRLTGVAVEHRSICNFVKVAAEMYGIRPWDRVYQRLPVPVDLSVEEIWVPWLCAATLVPRPSGAALSGRDLHAFLNERRLTAMWCVPSLLATIEEDLPDLRFLLVAGEACPEELITRWHKPGRRFIGAYSPAEATVSATWTELHPDKPVTIGIPLPTYSIVILDVDDPLRALPHGEVGEIGIAGIGLACGYLNRDDLTEKAFIPDFLGIPGNPSGRIYRTGDLGRITPDGEIAYLGRIGDRDGRSGYRTELDQLESALLLVAEDATPQPPPLEPVIVDLPADLAEPPPLEPAMVDLPADLAEPPPGQVAQPEPVMRVAGELAALLAEVLGVESVPVDGHVFDDLGADSMVMARFCARVRKRDDLPTVSIKDVYRNPTIRDLATAFAPASAAPATAPAATELAAVLAEVLGVESVPVDGHVFDDLGADSMVMARFCARVRKREDLPSVSMRDVYAQPTVARLAAALVPAAAPGAAAAAVASADSPDPPVITTSVLIAGTVRGARHRRVPTTGTPRYVLCGALQLLFLLGYPSLIGIAAISGYDWVADATGPVDIYLRSVLVGSATFVGLCALPVLAKWVLVGRWMPRQIRVWSMAYLRFWIVRTLVQRNPMALFVGSPLYAFYLRALGARVGRGVVILSRNVPVCTDLLTIGDDAVIRKDSFFTGYRAHDGVIQTGAVSIGRNVLVGEMTVLDIETSLGEGAQLGHASSLHTGQAVPAGQCWHGSPAQPSEVDYRAVPTTAISTRRRVVFSTVQLVNLLVLGLPLAAGVVVTLLLQVPQVRALLDAGPLAFTSLSFYAHVLVASSVLFFGAVLAGLLFVTIVPRLLGLLIKPGTVYPLYGVRYWAHRAIARITNVKFFAYLFGDSSYIVHYLRGLGYDLGQVEQTGSNFGQRVKHETPYLSSVGSGTVVADGLSFVNADFSSTYFRVSRASIGARSFLGNNVAYPSQARTGDNCLLATKVMVPIDGPVREGVGLLGSPPFEIPRSVQRDVGLEVADAGERRRRVRAKNRHNLVTIALFLLVRWGYVTLLTLAAAVAGDLHHSWGAAAIGLFNGFVLVVGAAYWVLVERTVIGLEALQPRGCSIYDRAFWRHERFWKVPAQAYLLMFNGTPLKNVIWRALGVRIGRRVFDDGCAFVEKRFVSVGDGCTLNAACVVQGHSQEDGAFKSDRIAIGAGCTLGVGAFVHYGVRMGEGAVLAADSFLMKGEEVPPNARWGGNPAAEMPEPSVDVQVRRIAISDAGAVLVRAE